MKMSVKLIILFSVLAMVAILSFSVISYQSSLNQMYNNTQTSLSAMGLLMRSEIEDYISTMEYSMKELTSNTDFMDALYEISHIVELEYPTDAVPVQTRMFRAMKQSPLASAFYRCSVYNRDGFFLSSRFETTNAVVSYSDEAMETIASLSYLAQADSDPSGTVFLGPRTDPWTIGEPAFVFSIVRAIMYHGEQIGYIEVSAPLDDLADIFLNLEQEGLSTQAIFDNGDALFRAYRDDYDYGTIPEGEMLYYRIDGGSDRLVIRQYSKTLGLSIYVSQEIDALGNTRAEILRRSLTIMLPILAAVILFIILISLGLTRSIRKLHNKIWDLPADVFLSRSDLPGPTHVVRPRDMEMYELEQSFNDMLMNLRISHENEVSLREGALKAQLNALQLQINPHFVYNTLNIISAKGLESGSEEITEICDQFARMLRYSTDVRSQTATLKEELENVRHYLYLCKMRYEDQLAFDIQVPESMLDTVLPRLTLQPLVENALKYGSRSSGIQNQIRILGSWEDGSFSLLVRDNGEGFDWTTLNELRRNFLRIEKYEQPDEPGLEGHLGLINTYRRIFYYSHGTLHMELSNDHGAVVKLTQVSEHKEEDL